MVNVADYWHVPVGLAWVWYMFRRYDMAVIAKHERQKRIADREGE